MKICTGCGESKSEYEFAPRKDRKNTTTSSKCRSCLNLDNRTTYDPVVHKARRIKSMYGLTLEDYYARLSNGCEICGSFVRLVLDHDHSCCPRQRSCGKCLRGALCDKHNVMLGRADDLVEILEASILYLNKYKESK